METTRNDAINGINEEIKGIKNELNRLHDATKLIPILESDLKTLESAKSILIGKNGNSRETNMITEIPKRKRTINPNSLGVLTMQAIKEAGSPLHVKNIVIKLEEKGKKATPIVVTQACIRLLNKGKLKRTYPNTFDIVEK